MSVYVIANLPFDGGDGNNKGTLPIDILNFILKESKKVQISNLMPTSFYKKILRKVRGDYTQFSKEYSQTLFSGAACPPLTIASLSNENKNEISKVEWFIPRTPLLDAIKKFQKENPSCYVVKSHSLAHSNLGLKDGKSTSAFDVECFKLYNQDFYERTLVFGMYWCENGVHSDRGDAVDNYWNYKLEKYEDFQKWVKDNNKHPDLHAVTFQTKIQKQNCEDWKHNGKLYGRILQEMNIGGGSIEMLRYPLLNLNWSQKWTDEKIIEVLKKDYGLPNDWEL